MVRISVKRSLIGLAVLGIVAVPSLVFAFSRSSEKPVNTNTYDTPQQETVPEANQATSSSPEVSAQSAAPQVAPAPKQQTAVEPPKEEAKNPYDIGSAQWHVFNRRAAVSMQMGERWVGNNGGYWLNTAKNDGYTVDKNFGQYAIAVRQTGPSAAMAFVEAVNGDGTLTFSAMNYKSGWNRTDTFQVTAEEIPTWTFIH